MPAAGCGRKQAALETPGPRKAPGGGALTRSAAAASATAAAASALPLVSGAEAWANACGAGGVFTVGNGSKTFSDSNNSARC